MRYENKVKLSTRYGKFAAPAPRPIIAHANRDRQFGHTDPVSPDHHGPESRWKKQARRRQRTKIPTRSTTVAKDSEKA